jgi:hypothetical protein
MEETKDQELIRAIKDRVLQYQDEAEDLEGAQLSMSAVHALSDIGLILEVDE